jgi:tripartite-type tricarboxylate transporter receptor subunit TctC
MNGDALMLRYHKIRALAAGTLMASALLAGNAIPAAADTVADFYRGKRIQLIIGYGSGGGYDTYARLLARFISAHIPGNPTIVAQNMPGAGSRNAANWLYNIAPKDGTALGVLSQTTPTDQVLGHSGIRFDVRKFNWIGNMVVVNNIMIMWAATGVKTIEDAKKRVLSIGATGAASPSVLYPSVSNNLFGTKFKIIAGYPGGGHINIAMERGEVDGRGSDSWASMKANSPDWIRLHKVNILFQVGPRREADLPDVVLWRDLGQNDEQKQILDVLSGDVAVGRPVLTPPGVPADRIAALRKAFDDTMKDPNYLEAAKKAHMYLNPMGGEELQGVVGRIVSTPPAIVAKVKAATKIMDLQRLPKGKGGKGKKK